MEYNNPTLFRDKYRIASARKKGWDYGSEGYYFVTICVRDRECIFGHIENDEMVLSDLGKIAENYWRKISDHFPSVKPDIFVVMPNHVHGIVVIGENRAVDQNWPENAGGPYPVKPNPPNTDFYSHISPKSKSLSAIIRSYKSICTRTINTQYPSAHFQWQSRFHDSIIHDETSLFNVRHYILNNPASWNKDRQNPLNATADGDIDDV